MRHHTQQDPGLSYQVKLVSGHWASWFLLASDLISAFTWKTTLAPSGRKRPSGTKATVLSIVREGHRTENGWGQALRLRHPWKICPGSFLKVHLIPDGNIIHETLCGGKIYSGEKPDASLKEKHLERAILPMNWKPQTKRQRKEYETQYGRKKSSSLLQPEATVTKKKNKIKQQQQKNT